MSARRRQSFAVAWLLWPIRAALFRELRKAKGGLYDEGSGRGPARRHIAEKSGKDAGTDGTRYDVTITYAGRSVTATDLDVPRRPRARAPDGRDRPPASRSPSPGAAVVPRCAGMAEGRVNESTREMTVVERIDQMADDIKARNAKEVARARQIALQQAYAAVASLNGNGRDEPSDPALDAALSAIGRLLDEAREPSQ
jgi:hypothetical protein